MQNLEFDKAFLDDLEQIRKEFQQKRKEFDKKLVKSIISKFSISSIFRIFVFILLLLVLALFMPWIIEFYLFVLFSIPFLVVLVPKILSLAFDAYIAKELESEFKDKVISRLIKEILPNLAYDKAKFIEFSEFNMPQIYNTKFDIYKGNDLILGNIDNVQLKFSDIYLAKTTNQKRKIRVETILFQGIVFIADFSKFFTAKVVVLDKQDFYYTSTNLKKIKMDNSEFNDAFNTHCDDEIAARYILTPNLMEKLLDMRKFFGSECHFCFIDNKIYAYINLGRDSFEANYKILLSGDSQALLHYKKEIMQFIEIVENLKLNSKIFKPNLDQTNVQNQT